MFWSISSCNFLISRTERMWRRLRISFWQFALARRMLGSFSLLDDEVIVVLFRLSEIDAAHGPRKARRGSKLGDL